MTKDEARRMLNREGVRSDAYDIDDRGCDECLRLVRDGGGWIVYYAERGVRTGIRDFGGESAALEYLCNRLVRDPTTRR